MRQNSFMPMDRVNGRRIQFRRQRDDLLLQISLKGEIRERFRVVFRAPTT